MSWRCAPALLVLAAALLPLLLGSATAAAALPPSLSSLSADGSGGPGAARAARARAAVNAGGVGGVASRMRRFPLLQVPLDVLDDDDESLFEANKRQMSDDYGHMRFGKRGGENDFAEYGHMRFGRAAA